MKGYTKGAVTQNVGEKGVNSVLDYVSSSNDFGLLQGFYEQTLDTLRWVSFNRTHQTTAGASISRRRTARVEVGDLL